MHYSNAIQILFRFYFHEVQETKDLMTEENNYKENYLVVFRNFCYLKYKYLKIK